MADDHEATIDTAEVNVAVATEFINQSWRCPRVLLL
jgi:hypothetical protein